MFAGCFCPWTGRVAGFALAEFRPVAGFVQGVWRESA